jgi:hypothetical protein
VHNSIQKYKIGLGIIGIFTLVIFVVLLLGLSATRQDEKTQKAANKIANSLNTYVEGSSSGLVPDNLQQAGITDVPNTITYRKTGDYSYVFCMDFKSTSSNFNASSVAENIMLRGAGGSSGDVANNYLNDPNLYNNQTILIINPEHHKGMNCETVSSY